MGSAAFLNEAINQLSEAYIDRKQKELGEMIPAEKRLQELQKVKMYIADRNVYGIDLNPVAVELAEVSLWLNTIYEGGFVPWFGTQLVNGNSLIGARRQVYSESALTATSKGMHWYENAPQRVPLGTERKKRRGNAQIYHFLLGDPGMCSYSDKVIKSLEPDNIKMMKNWNKKFTAPYSLSDLETLRGLSEVVDELWANQIKLRQTVKSETQDTLSVYGYSDTAVDSHTTIRQKDQIYSKLYKSEHMQNAGPYARLRFAMDYWCALWFWPIDKADMLPSRSEFLNDLNLILVGTFSSKGNSNMLEYQQLSLFPTERDEILMKINDLFPGQNVVDIDNLCTLFPRLALVREIAEQNHFMHWELEFADLFAERGGFDLVVGNPPWIRIEWKEQGILSDKNPMFAVKKLTATQTAQQRDAAFEDRATYQVYFNEFVTMTGEQNFIKSVQNYPVLKGQQPNLYRCFLPLAWQYGGNNGVSAFLHPDGVYDDPNAGAFREVLYPKLKYHFQFVNELRLFAEVHHSTIYSLNVYSNASSNSFESISNLYSVSTIEQCYDNSSSDTIPGLKDENGKWNTRGHSERVVKIGKKELEIFAKLFDGSKEWKQARFPVIHIQSFIDVLTKFSEQAHTIEELGEDVFTTQMWDETNAQKAGIIKRYVHFPENSLEMIYSGPHIWVGNPFAKTSRAICILNSDYDNIDLVSIPDEYFQRSNYYPDKPLDVYYKESPVTQWGQKYIDCYKIITRRMLGQSGERTLVPAIAPPGTSHINTIFGMTFKNNMIAFMAGLEASLPFDFYIKSTGKSDGRYDTLSKLPIPDRFRDEITVRSLLLNCLSGYYADLWKNEYKDQYRAITWTKTDPRLDSGVFGNLSADWKNTYPLRTDYSRRQALVEIDVLAAMALGMTLKQLIAIYQIQFYILHNYEEDTWYDSSGRIVFSSKNYGGLTYKRQEWESGIKEAPKGEVFTRTIIDDTMPSGPVEKAIDYIAPFDKCNREQDYAMAWDFFEKKYSPKN